MREGTMEVVAEFNEGRVIPRRIQYYDISSATYQEKEVCRLSYEIRTPFLTTYGVRFTDFEERILEYDPGMGVWNFADHLQVF